MKRRVLLVDDDECVLEGLKRVLSREPWEIIVACGGEAALALLETQPVDVVVSDERMPGISGTELLMRVGARYPETVRIVLTGHGSLEIAIRAINEGEVYRFLTKPCSPLELAVAIRQGLAHQDLLRESRRLLHTFRRQSAHFNELEREWKGLTRVERDASGAILLSDVPTDLGSLLHELETELAAADARLVAQDEP
jgi:DNA-binding NtrC family response regulator